MTCRANSKQIQQVFMTAYRLQQQHMTATAAAALLLLLLRCCCCCCAVAAAAAAGVVLACRAGKRSALKEHMLTKDHKELVEALEAGKSGYDTCYVAICKCIIFVWSSVTQRDTMTRGNLHV
jgi:hypothetical protein